VAAARGAIPVVIVVAEPAADFFAGAVEEVAVATLAAALAAALPLVIALAAIGVAAIVLPSVALTIFIPIRALARLRAGPLAAIIVSIVTHRSSPALCDVD
jgi:hypothetical protein